MFQNDFLMNTQILGKIYPTDSKTMLSQKLTRIKQKLKKPKQGAFVLASEYAEMKGINLVQLYALIGGRV
jgi:hypothetical protein